MYQIRISCREEGQVTTMAMMDEFKEERAKIKNGTPKEKLTYFWCYYKWHVIVGILAVIFVITVIRDVTNSKDTAFFAAMLNSLSLKQESTFAQDFAKYAGIDLNEQEVHMDGTMTITESATDESSVASSQRMMVYTASGELDVLVGGADIFPGYANGDMLYDLRELLTPEQIARYEPYFYYVDRSVVEALEAAETEYNPENPVTVRIPDPAKPEEMEDPIPIGLFVTDCKKLTEEYYFNSDYIALGVMVNSSNQENSLKFIDFLFE